jgi:hypothetical protein
LRAVRATAARRLRSRLTCDRPAVHRVSDLNFMISSSLDGTLKISEVEAMLTKRSPRISSNSISERQSRTTRV